MRSNIQAKVTRRLTSARLAHQRQLAQRASHRPAVLPSCLEALAHVERLHLFGQGKGTPVALPNYTCNVGIAARK